MAWMCCGLYRFSVPRSNIASLFNDLSEDPMGCDRRRLQARLAVIVLGLMLPSQGCYGYARCVSAPLAPLGDALMIPPLGLLALPLFPACLLIGPFIPEPPPAPVTVQLQSTRSDSDDDGTPSFHRRPSESDEDCYRRCQAEFPGCEAFGATTVFHCKTAKTVWDGGVCTQECFPNMR